MPKRTPEEKKAHQREYHRRWWASLTPEQRKAHTTRMNANRRKNWTEKKRKRAYKKRGEWLRANSERFSKTRRAAAYGLSPEMQDALFIAQGKCCACCGGSEPRGKNWHLDHDHVTGRVRAFLCGPCNSGLGLFRDDPALLDRAAEYLRRYGK